MLKKIALAAALVATAATPALAQSWPAKTVHIMVPFGPGSTPDIVARIIADGLKKQYPDSAFVVENKPGASGNIGTDAVAKAAPDGGTIGVSIGGPLAINTLLFSKLPYDPRKDITAVTQLITQPSALAVIKAGTRLVHLSYPSSPQAVTAIIRNDAQMGCLPAISVVPQAKAGTLKILAVSTAKRSPYLPDVPTLKESGIDVEADAWMGLIAPGGMPKAMVDAINKDVVAIITKPDVKKKLGATLMEPVGSSPEHFRALIDREVARWAPVIKAANVKVN
jgi:tripartite-type tricarboxylate transporter receptor subunit TctC